ncbi:hypothetical protein IscW_ISCW015855 [Ixodes scapularis]|uniref:Uncharacterized protein n=1 Tax=Ixodes scapularis TaxID=6945 RepID=B7P5B7_IXOSC|nr:hypothetical protein IscW_ISCW015855 [Ixodes scapularis]|eukprot:XP_002407229.1 hypothetical protein IscW_ISCW015855 [Ixodes scapularis]
MWSQVQAAAPLASSEAGPEEQQRGCGPLAPSSRSKHAMCISQDGCFYLLAGRSANLPLKDLWRFDPDGSSPSGAKGALGEPASRSAPATASGNRN